MLYKDNKRMDMVDIFKAIAIFCVIVSHCPIVPLQFKQLIESFTMPIFFVAIGLTYNIEKHANHGFFHIDFVKDKFIRLMVPCYLFGLIYAQLTAKNMLYILYGSQQTFRQSGGLSSLWFLPCCFLSVCFFEILIGVVYKIQNRKWFHFVMILSVLFFSGISYILPDVSVGYPWEVNVAFMGLAFIIMGYEMKEIIKKIDILNNENFIVWAALLIVPIVVLLLTFQHNLIYITTLRMVDFATATYGNIYIYMLDALCGIIASLSASVLISKIRISKYLVYVGQNTFLVFLLHKPIIITLSNMLVSRVSGLTSIPGFFFLISLIVLIITLILSEIIKKIQRELTGKIKF